ncbi:MAG: ribbon-helix-helix domain-containing protein [Alphaproteobacteria bacterium]|nr:ribbon-helix-helix domain-containing protein [Alphaproteobacteria bacterium]MCZ6496865.1 ribbon-helix-helix domain-containing protein [Alphaproteobacteria bacterium]MCZ6610934.1 ribbon-helix-helix domain-containing protein [Alphaproteobacteria bacterium]MCZ6742252.1 ribbon-helix-helix domain-containing protein [Alphaproteobacteria bacterium]MCZ6813209.1 ribbon-helix-helix domain-containing protein [Alphaproteobacteria bacterium]
MLHCKNVNVSGRRTSIRIEEELWSAAEELCLREGMTLHELCTVIDQYRGFSGLTAALRVFLIVYYRLAASEPGHAKAGHGAIPDRGRSADRWRPFIAQVFAGN